MYGIEHMNSISNPLGCFMMCLSFLLYISTYSIRYKGCVMQYFTYIYMAKKAGFYWVFEGKSGVSFHIDGICSTLGENCYNKIGVFCERKISCT